jgi:hypothetical protein
MAENEPEFVCYTDEDGFRRQVRPEDVDSAPDYWTPEDEPKTKPTQKPKPKS